MKPGVKFRCDGSKEIGLGHIYRMIALSNLLEDDFECCFIVQKPETGVTELLKKNNCKLEILEENDLNFPGVHTRLNDPIMKNDILVLDGYHFDAEYQHSIRSEIRCKLVCVDDIILNPFIADIVINHAGGLAEIDFQTELSTQLLLGPRYAILRKEFYGLSWQRMVNEKTSHFFVNFGGADIQNLTCKLIKEILQLRSTPRQIIVVAGAVFRHYEELQAIANKYSFVKVYQNITADAMVKLMKQADVAICSSSTIAYEFCSVTGLLYVLQTAENQSGLYKFLINERLALPYSGSAELVSDAVGKKQELIVNQKRYFDGQAGCRLKKEFNRLYFKNNIFLRRAVREDLDTYFKWANDKEVRMNSFNTDPISYDSHCSWFKSNIDSPKSFFYIFCSGEDIPVGNIRFILENDTATLGFLIDQKFRGLGLGKKILTEGTKAIFQDNQNVKKLKGFVKADNAASIKAFNASRFQEVESNEPNVKCFIKTFNDE